MSFTMQKKIPSRWGLKHVIKADFYNTTSSSGLIRPQSVAFSIIQNPLVVIHRIYVSQILLFMVPLVK